MSMPHHFPSLIDGPVQVVLIVGTGLSTPITPTVKGLTPRMTKIAVSQGVSSAVDPDTNDFFYSLAEAVLEKLINSDGKSESESRLWLAEQLEMLDDRRWFGEFGLPLSGNTPRHRAIARFAIEERLRAIISLNWDALLEAALVSVGLGEDSSGPRPWKVTTHARIAEVADKHLLGNPRVFPVIKPHGCVRALSEARRRHRSNGAVTEITFRVTTKDLSDPGIGRYIHIDAKVPEYASECPILTVGWKADEAYLRDTIVNTVKVVAKKEQDAFTVVNRTWYPSHDEIATAYGKTRGECFAEVGKGATTCDQLFMWLQARYALTRLAAASSSPQEGWVRTALKQLDTLDCSSPLIGWADNWLPTWVRLCWRAGIMQAIDPYTGQSVDPATIPVMPRDAHVPLGAISVKRHDLQAAARLLVALGDDLRRFNFSMFPGGFWLADANCLYLPLPGWKGGVSSVDLAALKPMVEALSGFGFVRAFKLVWLDATDSVPDPRLQKELEAQLQRQMKLTHFAGTNAITWVDLDAMKGDLP